MKMKSLGVLLYGVLLITSCFCRAFSVEKASEDAQSLPDAKELIIRLEKHVQLLTIFVAQHKVLCNGCMESIEAFLIKLDYHKRFSHELTVLSLKAMLCTRNLDLFLKTWDVFIRVYNVVDPNLFLKEYSQIVFVLYSILGAHVGGDALVFSSKRDNSLLSDSSSGEVVAMLDDYCRTLCADVTLTA
jgi:hypothetical protein